MDKKRGIQLPPDWVPGPQGVAYGLKNGLTEAQIQREGERFRNWAVSRGEVKRDWLAAWRNWVLKACDIYGIPPPTGAVTVLSDDERERLIRKYSKK